MLMSTTTGSVGGLAEEGGVAKDEGGVTLTVSDTA